MEELIISLRNSSLSEKDITNIEERIAAKIDEAAFEDSFYTLNISILAKILDKAKSIKPKIIERLLTNFALYLGNDFLVLLKYFKCDELELSEAIKILDSIKISPLIREITNSIKKSKQLPSRHIDDSDVEDGAIDVDWETIYRDEKNTSDSLRAQLEEERLKKIIKVKVEELFDACRAKDIKKLKDLYEIDPMCITLTNYQGASPLNISSNIGWIEGVEFLLEKGSKISGFVDCNSSGFTPLYSAVAKGHLEIVKKLIEKGANVNIPTKTLDNCLREACLKENMEIIKILVEAGANIEVRSKADYTPLGYSARQGHLEVVKYLHSKGAKIDSWQNKGYTPLYLACEQGKRDVAEYLIQNNVNTQPNSFDNMSPIEVAAQKGHLNVVQLWVEKSLPFSNKAIEIAIRNKHQDIAQYLKKRLG